MSVYSSLRVRTNVRYFSIFLKESTVRTLKVSSIKPFLTSSATLVFGKAKSWSVLTKYALNSILYTSDSRTTVMCSPKLEDFGNIITDAQSEKTVKVILMEYNVLKEMGYSVPSYLSVKDMTILLEMKLYNQRRKYITRYLYSRENTITENLKRKVERKEIRKHFKPDTEHIRYDLGHNCLHFRIRKDKLYSVYAHCLAQAAKFGQPLIFDFDYDQHMNRHEFLSATMQLAISFAINRHHSDPFDMYFCNLREESSQQNMRKFLKIRLPDFESNPMYMLTVTEKGFLDIFPDKRKIIYLTPDAQDVMYKFDHEAIYIIGGLVDRGSLLPRSLGKAKQNGIRALKLPLDKYLLFSPTSGDKCMTLNVMTKILLELKVSGDWNEALKHVPRRRVLTLKEIQEKGERSRTLVNFDAKVLSKKLVQGKGIEENRSFNYKKS